ncbi:uncharacterized protein LOC128608494 isoform X2 [Ictalurus furcatus]|uniref:uncharacterized protein LOC128608494 isoform X2 n=1 Tax=Ictalurus furcatus TaxID=66913 RepID=UPI002350A44D|nr:uncharacterized protein LOC128608494 isoform X2 [Ictalurus furcatus]
MPRHSSRGNSRMPRQQANQVRTHMPPRNRMKTNTGFRRNAHHTTRTRPNPGVRGNFHHKKRTNPNPVNAGNRGIRPNQIRHSNPGFRRNTHHTSTHPNSGAQGRGKFHHKKRTNPNPVQRQALNKLILQAVKGPMPPVRKPLSVVEMLKKKLKANRELAVRPRVQRTRTPAMSGLPVHKAVKLLKQKLKSNRELMIRPKVQRTITPVMTVHPVRPIASVYDHTPASAVPYQPRHQVRYDHGNMTPHSSQVASDSAASAQSHKIEKSPADNENITEITDENLLFLNEHRAELIDKVKNVVRILDYLELSNENAAIVRAQLTDQAMMRKLLEFTTSKRAAELLIKVLLEEAGDVIEDLKDSSDDEDDAGDDVD